MGKLTSEDYQQLFELSLARDPRAAEIAKTLSPEEQQEFFDWQQAYHKEKGVGGEYGRPDASIAGFPAELGALAPLMAGGSIGAGIKSMIANHPLISGIAAMKAADAIGIPHSWLIPVLMNKGGASAAVGAAEGAAGLTAAEVAQLEQQGYPRDLITKIGQRASMPAAKSMVPNGSITELRTPSNLERLKPGSGASAEQVGEMQSRRINDWNALGMKKPGAQSPFDKPAEFANPGAREEWPLGLKVKSPDAFQQNGRISADLSGDEAEIERVRALIRKQLEAKRVKCNRGSWAPRPRGLDLVGGSQG